MFFVATLDHERVTTLKAWHIHHMMERARSISSLQWACIEVVPQIFKIISLCVMWSSQDLPFGSTPLTGAQLWSFHRAGTNWQVFPTAVKKTRHPDCVELKAEVVLIDTLYCYGAVFYLKVSTPYLHRSAFDIEWRAVVFCAEIKNSNHWVQS